MKKMSILLTVLVLLSVLLISGCGDSGGGGSSTCPYTGTWVGTWSIPSLSDYGSESLVISNNGNISGTISDTPYGLTTNNVSGSVSGNNFSFSYQWSGQPSVTASGTFSSIVNNHITGNFTIVYNNVSVAGTLSLNKQ